MKVTQKKINDGKLLLTAQASAKEVDSAFESARLLFAQQSGFSPMPNKTLDQIAEEALGIKDLDAVVAPQVINHLMPFALEKNDTVPAYPPKPSYQKAPARGQDFSFTLDVVLKPEYELPSYEPISIKIPVFQIDEREIDARIAQMAESYAEFVTDEPRPIRENDAVLIAMEASDENDEPIPALVTEARTYLMNANLMPPEFDENLMGMNVGETKSFAIAGPSRNEGGKEVKQEIKCKITVKEIQKKVVPAVTDEWVSKNFPLFMNLTMMKNAMRSELESARKFEYDQYVRQLASAELATRFEGKIADEMYEAMRDSLLENLQMQLNQQGMSMEDFLAQNGGEQQFNMMLMMQTRQTLVEGYSLDALFRHEKLSIDDDDLFDAARLMDPQNPQQVKDRMLESGFGYALRENARRIKAGKWLVEHANVEVEQPAG